MRPSLLNKREERRKKLTAKSERWYDIKNKTGDVAEIRIYDEIGWFGVTAEEFVKDLDEITADEIVVAINCPGGDVFDGIAIYNALRTHPATVTTRVDSLAASIASIIAQAGDHRVMLTSGQMMIHDAWGLSIGNAKEMREMADLLDRQSDVIAGIYASRGSGDVAYYRALMEQDRWFTDEEAVAEGLADEVLDPSEMKNTKAAVVPQISNKVSDPVEETAPDTGSSPGTSEEVPVDDPVEEVVDTSGDEELELRARALALQAEV